MSKDPKFYAVRRQAAEGEIEWWDGGSPDNPDWSSCPYLDVDDRFAKHIATKHGGEVVVFGPLPPAPPVPVPTAPEEWAWIRKMQETAHGPFPSREAAIENAFRCCDTGEEVLVDTITWAHVCEYVDAEAFVEHLGEIAYGDNYGFHDDLLYEIATSKAEAQEALCDWAEKHLTAERVWHTDGGNNAVTVVVEHPLDPATTTTEEESNGR